MRGVEFYGLPVLWIGNSHPIYDLCTGTHPCCWWSWLYIVWFIWEIIELGAIPQYLHVLCVTNICTTPTWKTISKAIYRVSTLQKTQTWKIYHKSQLRHDFPNLFSMLLGGVYKRHQGRYRHLAKMGSSPSVAEPSEDWRLGAAGLGESRAAQGDARSLSCDHLLLQGRPGDIRWAPSQWPKCGDRKLDRWDGFLAGASSWGVKKVQYFTSYHPPT